MGREKTQGCRKPESGENGGPAIDTFELPEEFLIVGAAVRAGIVEALRAGPIPLEALIERTGSSRRVLWTVLEALADLGYLVRGDGRYGLTDAAFAMFYDDRSPAFRGFAFMHTYDLFAKWLRLPDLLRPKMPEHEAESLDRRFFVSAMRRYASASADAVAAYGLRDLEGRPHVLDIGGGPLTYAVAFARKGASVTVLDRPEVLDLMRPELDPALPVRLVSGDFTQALPDGTYDVAYLGNICHIYGEAENRDLFGRTAKHLNPGGRLVINDFLRGTGADASVFAVNMLVNTETGGTWTFAQYEAWLEDAGFSVQPHDEVAGTQLITAHKR